MVRWRSGLMFKRFFAKSEDAARERYRLAALTSVLNIGAQGIQLLTALVSVPLVLAYVGVERFGIWMTLSTALAFMAFSDLGVGIGLQDRLAKLRATNQFQEASRVFISVLGFIIVIFFVLISLSEFFVPHVNWAELLSLQSEEAVRDLVPTARMVIFIVAIGLIAGIIQRGFVAVQEGFIVAVIQIGSRIVSLVLLFIVVNLQLGLPALVFVVGGIANVAIIFFGLPILLFRHGWLLRAFGGCAFPFDPHLLLDVLKVGLLGLGAAVAIYLVNNTPLALVSIKYGAAESADLAVLLKLTTIPVLFLTYVLLPLWPAITEARAKSDIAWIRRTYTRCRTITVVVIFGSVGLLLAFGQSVIFFWAGKEAVVPSVALLCAGVFFLAMGLWNVLVSVMLNGLSKYSGQATYGFLIAACSVIAAFYLPGHLGKEWVLWVIGAGFLLRCCLMQWELRRSIKRLGPVGAGDRIVA
jgi:O-antigen/teichoic acid export membrane protein